MILWLLAACSGTVGTLDKADDTGGLADSADSADSGSSGDSADSTDSTPVDTSAPDSGDSADSADSADSGDSGEDTAPPPATPVRFVVLGDGGEGNDAQYEVADAMRRVCDAKADDRPGCGFALYLGDNFYDDGVNSVDDEQFQTKFELPYEVLDFPFWVVLGNHDYGELSILGYKADFEVEYTDYSDKWTMPDHYYAFTEENVQFLGLDTNQIMLEDLWGDSGQGDWIEAQFASSTAQWQIAFGHHPYRSNGAHGNAGEYEGYEWLPIANGATVEDFMDEHFCEKVDVYFCGHDHNRQWLEPVCGVDLVVSGAAAKTTELEDRGNPVLYEDDTTEGFLWVEIVGGHLHGEFYDRSGDLVFAHDLYR